jgi:hypothetical protein
MIKDKAPKKAKKRRQSKTAPVASPEKPDTPTTPARRPLSPALKRVAERALQVSDEELSAYLPREIDVRIAEAFLSGATNFQGVAEQLELTPPTISKVLRDPLPCAWIAQKIRSLVVSRLGLVDAAMLGRALGGNTNAARLLYDRFDGMGKQTAVDIGEININYGQYTDQDLDAMIKSRKNQILEIAANVSTDEQRPASVGAEPLEADFEEIPASHNATPEGGAAEGLSDRGPQLGLRETEDSVSGSPEADGKPLPRDDGCGGEPPAPGAEPQEGPDATAGA